MNVGTTYNANVGTMKQYTMRMLEQLKFRIMEQCITICIPEEGRRRVSGKYGVSKANEAGRDLLDWC